MLTSYSEYYDDIPEANRDELAQTEYNNMDEISDSDTDLDETPDAPERILAELLDPNNFSSM